MSKERLFLIVTVLFSLLCCYWFIKLTVDSYKRSSALERSAVLRAEYARNNPENEIKIAVVYDGKSNDVNMVKASTNLALQEINSSDLLKDKQLIVEYYDDEGLPTRARQIAQKLADDRKVSIVIGHPTSTSAIKIQPIYEFYGLLFFSPAASNPGLSQNGARYFFRNYPNDHDMGEFFAGYCRKRGWKNLAIICPDSEYGRAMANTIESLADFYHLKIVVRKEVTPQNVDFAGILKNWITFYDIDVVVSIFQALKDGNRLLAAAAETDFRKPILFTPDLFRVKIPKGLKSKVYIADITPSINKLQGKALEFSKKLQEKANITPDFLAVNYYDALHVIAEAISQAGNSSAADVAAALKKTKTFSGAGGNFTFKANGDCERELFVIEK